MIILCLLPALFSCSSDRSGLESETVTTSLTLVKSAGASSYDRCDILAFENDRTMNLDSYQQIPYPIGNNMDMRSQGGDKIVFICANSQWDIYGWSNIRTLESLSEIYADLRKEKRGRMLMTGCKELTAGQAGSVSVIPLASEILLRSIKTDFTGRSYEGQKIKDAKAYLINVNVRCCILEEDDMQPTHLVNIGGLNMEETEEFIQKDLIIQKIDEDIGTEKVKTGISLFCYPNESRMEGPGTPFTRLVIEGVLDGERFWWPIDINRGPDTGDTGIERNTRHIYDIVIKRKGSKDPDTALDIEYIDFNSEVKPWEEKEDCQIFF